MTKHIQPSGTLDSLRFDNRFVNELPVDPATENRRRQVFAACSSRVLPARVSAPKLVACSPETAALLGLPLAFDLLRKRGRKRPDWIAAP